MYVVCQVGNFTRLTPKQRQEVLHQFLDTLKEQDDARIFLDEWGLKLDTTTPLLEGRQLPPGRLANTVLQMCLLLHEVRFISTLKVKSQTTTRLLKRISINLFVFGIKFRQLNLVSQIIRGFLLNYVFLLD